MSALAVMILHDLFPGDVFFMNQKREIGAKRAFVWDVLADGRAEMSEMYGVEGTPRRWTMDAAEVAASYALQEKNPAIRGRYAREIAARKVAA